MHKNAVTVLIRMQLLPDSVQQGRRNLIALAREVRSVEPECLSIEMAEDMDDPTRITMIEKWASRAAYEGPHMDSPHMQAFIETSAKHFVGPPDISFCRGTEIGTT